MHEMQDVNPCDPKKGFIPPLQKNGLKGFQSKTNTFDHGTVWILLEKWLLLI